MRRFTHLDRFKINDLHDNEHLCDYVSDDIQHKILRVVCKSDLPHISLLNRLKLYSQTITDAATYDTYIFNPRILNQSPLLGLPVDLLVEVYDHLSDFQKMLFYSNGTFVILRRLNRDIKSQVSRVNIYDKLKQIPALVPSEYMAMLADTSQIDSYEMNHSFRDNMGTVMYGLIKEATRDDFGAIRDIISKIYKVNRYVAGRVSVDISLTIDLFLFVAEAITVGIDPYFSNKEHHSTLPHVEITDDESYNVFEKRLDIFMSACVAINTYKDNPLSEGIRFVKKPIFPLRIHSQQDALRHYKQIKANLSDFYKKEFIKLISTHDIYQDELSALIKKDAMDIVLNNK